VEAMNHGIEESGKDELIVEEETRVVAGERTNEVTHVGDRTVYHKADMIDPETLRDSSVLNQDKSILADYDMPPQAMI
jgi:hypothetical protein